MSKGFIQHNNLPSHISGGTLDLVLTQEAISDHILINGLQVEQNTGTHSDHYFIHFNIPMKTNGSDAATTTEKTKDIRKFRDINMDAFRTDIAVSLPPPNSYSSLEEAVNTYNTVLTKVIDKHAPSKSITLVKQKRSCWWNHICQTARRTRRAAERAYKKNRDDQDASENYRNKCMEATSIINHERDRFYKDKLSSVVGNATATYKVVNRLLDKQYGENKLPNGNSDIEIANDLKCFFKEKVDKIYGSIKSQLSSDTSPMIMFNPNSHTIKNEAKFFKIMTSEEISEIINEMANKSCESDPIPTWLFKNCIDELIPTVTLIVNASLQFGIFPECLKLAVVRATIKKVNLDSDDLKNYRPISNLTFLSKIIEKCVHKQLTYYISKSDLFATFQSGYRKEHSCETAVLKIHNDILLMIDKNNHVVLMLLDLSAAFDTINHDLLIKKLKKNYGFEGRIIDWIKSYLSNRSFRVSVNNTLSESAILEIGVPQGSILGPLLFILYTKEIEEIASKYGFSVHLYADDSQIYFSFDPKTQTDRQLNMLQQCFIEIKQWMSSNFLKMNDSKTEIMEIHGPRLKTACQSSFQLDANCNVEPTSSAKNLGFYFDSKLNLDVQLNNVSRTCYMNLRNISRIGSKLGHDLKVQLVHSCILSVIDNCNATYGALKEAQLNKLQKIQNAAVRFIYGPKGKKRRDHITPYLKKLHFLPVRYRISFKIALLVFKCINNKAPKYLMDMICLRIPNRHATRNDDDYFILTSPPTPHYSNTNGAFSYSGPNTWNALPYRLRSMTDVKAFKIALKGYYFNLAFQSD